MSIAEPTVSQMPDESPAASVAPIAPPRPRRHDWRGAVIFWMIFAGVVAGSIWIGLPIQGSLRHWVFEETRPIRFREDATRGFYWGRQAVEHGYLGLYGSMRGQSPLDERWLDYAPLRLGVMTFWAHVNAGRLPDKPEYRSYQNTFEFAKPVLWVNTGIELFGALGMFLLVRHWVIRHRRGYLRNGEHARRLIGEGGVVRESVGYTGVVPGLIAALLLWFNPAILISAYGWPTWDVWIIPFYVWAIYLACVNQWFLAGVMVAIGAMFKGQILAVAGIFLVWPLVSGYPRTIFYLLVAAILALGVRLYFADAPMVVPADTLPVAGRVPGAVAGWVFVLSCIAMLGFVVWGARWTIVFRWTSGFVFGIGAIVSPWMLRHAGSGLPNKIAAGWVLATVLWTIAALAGVYWIRTWTFPFLPLGRLSQTRFGRYITPGAERNALIVWVSAVLFAAIVVSTFFLVSHFYFGTVLLALVAAVGVSVTRGFRSQAILIAAVIGGSLLLCMPLYKASDAWYVCGWKFGTKHFDRLIVGAPDNIPALLQVRYAFDGADTEYPIFDIAPCLQFGWPAEATPVNLKVLMKGIFILTSLPCMVAAATHFRRGDKRFLVAMTTPWLLFFLFPLQIHERYLLFAAGIAACFVAHGVGMTLLYGFLSVSSFVMILNILEKPARREEFASEGPNSIFVRYGQELRDICAGAHPDLAWALLLAAMILIFLSVTPSPRRKSIELPRL